MTAFSPQTKQAICACCTLAQIMRDCQNCQFYIPEVHARLWGVTLKPLKPQLKPERIEEYTVFSAVVVFHSQEVT